MIYFMEMVALDSSFIAGASYNTWTRTLVVFMHNGNRYPYHRVPYSVFISLINVSSPGVYYNAYIKGRYS